MVVTTIPGQIRIWKYWLLRRGENRSSLRKIQGNRLGDLWRHCGGLGIEILMPYPINQSWREQIELNWIGAHVGLWDTAFKFLSPGPRNDVTDHLGENGQQTQPFFDIDAWFEPEPHRCQGGEFSCCCTTLAPQQEIKWDKIKLRTTFPNNSCHCSFIRCFAFALKRVVNCVFQGY